MEFSSIFRRNIAIGIIVRLALMPFIAHPYDMFAWYTYVEGIIAHGVSSNVFSINPIWDLLLITLAYTYNTVSNVLHISAVQVSALPPSFNPSYGVTVITDPVFNILLKTPFVIADVLSSFLIYRIAHFYSHDSAASERVASLYFLSPIVIWISAAWGQYDSIAVLFTLLSFYFLLVSKNSFVSVLSLYTAILVKVYPIVFLIPITIAIVRFDRNKHWKVMLILLPLIPIGVYLVLFQRDEFVRLLTGLIFPRGFLLQEGFLFGLTYWSVSMITHIDVFWSRLVMNLVMSSMVLLSLYYIIRKSKSNFETVVGGAFLLVSTFFLSLPIVSEQRSLILLAVLSLVMLRYPIRRIYFISLSLLAFIYAQKNFPFYLLPLASRFQDSFIQVFNFSSTYIDRSSGQVSPTLSSGLILFIIGSAFSGLLLILVYNIFKSRTNRL